LIEVSPIIYEEKEKEHILLFEAKKKYFMHSQAGADRGFNLNDSLAVDEMQVKDSSFVRYLDRLTRDSIMFTLQEKCAYMVGKELVLRRFSQLITNRE